MKMINFTVASVVFVLVAITSQAQIHLGATTAYNATFVLDKGLSEDPRYNSTYTYNFAPVGFSFGVDFGRKFGLSLESILSNQGQIYELVNVGKQIAGERKIDLQYLQLPLMMKFMGGGQGKARGNFNFGPQLSLLTKARETIQANAGEYKIPEGVDITEIQKDFPGAEASGNGNYTIPDVPTKDLLTKQANDFKNAEFQLAVAFGLDIDLSKHMFLTTQVRANYSLTDMRNGDVLDAIKNGNTADIFGSRANLLVGVQIGLHYYFGTLRSFK
ncbi:MAG: outer membrane beta-barrel protein [Cyclobacteriaceae bacterium]|nr:outer membrane beta-barrel protein [Cyclobacteriaceae bacterium]